MKLEEKYKKLLAFVRQAADDILEDECTDLITEEAQALLKEIGDE